MLLLRRNQSFRNFRAHFQQETIKKRIISFFKSSSHSGKYQHCLHGSGLLGSEKQRLLEFTCYRSEMLKHSSEKPNFIPKKKWNERQRRRQFKVFRLPFLISQRKRLFDQSSFTIQMSLGVFQSNRNDFDFCDFDVYFAYFSVWNFICQICGLIRQAKRS
jgi:hypothetical protein